MSETVASDAEVRSGGRTFAERILIVAPTGDDASLAARLLAERDLDVTVLGDLASLANAIAAGAGVVLLTSESLADEGVQALRQVLDEQEPWSELPVLLLGRSVDSETAPAAHLLGSSANLIVLERPLGLATFLTVIDAALRTRRRQYQVKQLLDQLAESSLQVTRAHAEATRAKDEFLATLGHELRSPMTAIRGWIQLLRMGGLGPAEADEALSMIESSTKVQAHIIEDLMDMSRIIAGKTMIDPAVVELAPVVTNVVATFLPAAALEGVQLRAAVCSEPLIVFADASRLQQVGWNLVSNAIKFTPRGGSVLVSLERDDRWAVIRIRDTGRGISSDLLPYVFDRYRQAEGGERRGLGLGLAIVKHLVESQDGTIEAFSAGPGKGAEFVMKLPLRSAVPSQSTGAVPAE